MPPQACASGVCDSLCHRLLAQPLLVLTKPLSSPYDTLSPCAPNSPSRTAAHPPPLSSAPYRLPSTLWQSHEQLFFAPPAPLLARSA